MSKVAGSSRFVEVPHVIGSTEDIWDTVAPVGTVDAARVAVSFENNFLQPGQMVPATASVDHSIWLCLANGQQG